jgi:hypothetical protein
VKISIASVKGIRIVLSLMALVLQESVVKEFLLSNHTVPSEINTCFLVYAERHPWC